MLLQILDFCSDSKDIWILVGKVIRIILIVIPVIIVLLGTLDLGKAVMAGEEKEITAAQKMLIKRIIYGVVIFFIPTIIATIYGLFSGTGTEGGEASGSNLCWKCAIERKC